MTNEEPPKTDITGKTIKKKQTVEVLSFVNVGLLYLTLLSFMVTRQNIYRVKI